jgi:streptogramin lyase
MSSRRSLLAFLRRGILLGLALSLGVAPTRGDIAGITVATPSLSKPVAPRLLAAGPDGKVWFSDETALPHSVGFFTPAGAVSSFRVPCDGCDGTGNNNLAYIEGMTVTADGNLWFLYTRVDGSGSFVDGGLNNYVGRMTPAGSFTQFPVPTKYAFRRFAYSVNGHSTITSGPDGNLWFTEPYGNRIGKITPAGALSEYSLPCTRVIPAFPENLITSRPTGITAGPDGNLWFMESECDRIGRLTPSGVLAEFPLASGSTPVSIVTGSDGNLWFLEYGMNKIGRITPAGTITEYALPAGPHVPASLVAAPDGNLWFTDYISSDDRMSGQVGQLVLPIPTTGGTPAIHFAGIGSGNKPYDVVFTRVSSMPAGLAVARPNEEVFEAFDLWMSATDAGFADTVIWAHVMDNKGCDLLVELLDKAIFVAPGANVAITITPMFGSTPYDIAVEGLPDGLYMEGGKGKGATIKGRVPSDHLDRTFIYVVTVTDAKGCRVSITGSITIIATSRRRPAGR